VITGRVKDREARIELRVRGTGKRERTIPAVIDTGFTAFLTLPPALIASLGLTWKSSGRGILADGSECLFDVYAGKVVWDGKVRNILIDEADTDPLVGMALLTGYELKVQICPGGKVRIKPIGGKPAHGARHRQDR
jgi:clan AA aspartic protease